MNYFKYHGASKISIREKDKKILKNAIAWGEDLKIKRFNEDSCGSFIVEDYNPSSCFVSKGKLYYFIQSRSYFDEGTGKSVAPIESFFELNKSKDRCVNGNCGAYFQFGIKPKKLKS